MKSLNARAMELAKEWSKYLDYRQRLVLAEEIETLVNQHLSDIRKSKKNPWAGTDFADSK